MISVSDIGKRVRFLGGDALDSSGKPTPILGRVVDADYAIVKVEWDDGEISLILRDSVEQRIALVP